MFKNGLSKFDAKILKVFKNIQPQSKNYKEKELVVSHFLPTVKLQLLYPGY